jgi:serine/threonine protein phosphatase PrpC
MKLAWHAAGDQRMGARRYQEDRYGIREDRGRLLAVVADGMGGHAGGAIASQLAIDAFIAIAEDGTLPVAQRLSDGLSAATEAIAARARRDATLLEMGSTLVAVIVEDGALHWISVGDSPFWLHDGRALARLNADHSMRPVIEEMIADGRLTEAMAARHPSRNALRSVLTLQPPAMIDTGTLALPQSGVTLLLASDGIETLNDATIDRTLQRAARPEDAVEALLAAIERAAEPWQDNTTVIVLRAADGKE